MNFTAAIPIRQRSARNATKCPHARAAILHRRAAVYRSQIEAWGWGKRPPWIKGIEVTYIEPEHVCLT